MKNIFVITILVLLLVGFVSICGAAGKLEEPSPENNNTIVGTWLGESFGVNNEGRKQVLSVKLVISEDFTYSIQLSYNYEKWLDFIKGNASVDDNNIVLTATSNYNNEEENWVQINSIETYNFTGTLPGSKIDFNRILLIKQ